MIGKFRRVAFPILDPYTRKYLDKYLAYTLSEDEYIGEIDESGLTKLKKAYHTNNLSAAKFHPESGNVDDGSFRKVDPESPRWQYHIHIFGNEVFSHYEYRPDFRTIADETHRERVNRLQEHYRPTRGESYLEGVADETIQDLTQ